MKPKPLPSLWGSFALHPQHSWRCDKSQFLKIEWIYVLRDFYFTRTKNIVKIPNYSSCSCPEWEQVFQGRDQVVETGWGERLWWSLHSETVLEHGNIVCPGILQVFRLVGGIAWNYIVSRSHFEHYICYRVKTILPCVPVLRVAPSSIRVNWGEVLVALGPSILSQAWRMEH